MASIFAGLADVFTCTFGQTVTIVPEFGAPRDVQGIFTERPVDALGVVMADASLHIQDPDVQGATDGDQAVVSGVTYKLREPRPDGFGMTAYTLERVS